MTRQRADRQQSAACTAVAACLVLIGWEVVRAGAPGSLPSLPWWLPPVAGVLIFVGLRAIPTWTSARFPGLAWPLFVAMAIPPAVLATETLAQGDTTREAAQACAATAGVVYPMAIVWLHTSIRRLEQQTCALNQLAQTDHLTGLINRRSAETRLHQAMRRSQRRRQSLTIALFDLDHFKAYNDQYGHPARDALLSEAARVWLARLGTDDLLARYGGEEFLLISAHGADPTLRLISRMRADTPHQQSFSAGIAQWDGTEPINDLIARADQALYRAKAAGRRRSELAVGLAA